MKRYLNWVLGGLAAITAVAALRRKPDVAPVDGIDAPVASESQSGWQRLVAFLQAVQSRMKEHNIPMIAGSLSYYAFLAVFPAAIAAISVYGMVLDPSRLTTQINDLAAALPESTRSFISNELRAVASSSSSGLTYAAVFSIIGALWSASAGTKALMTGIDIAYATPEDRSFLVKRAMALGITVALIVFVAVAASAATFLPYLLDALGAEGLIRFVQYGRWPIIFIMVLFGLGVLFKIAPCRPAAKSPWISVGSVVVAILWLLATLGLSLYSSIAGSLGAAYGTISGLFVLMLWFFISGLIVLFGAEVNAELEKRDLARFNFRNGHPGR